MCILLTLFLMIQPNLNTMQRKIVITWTLAGLLLAAALSYGAWQFQAMQKTSADIATLRDEIQTLTGRWEHVNSTYRDLKQTIAQREAERTEAINAIFPPEESLTEFTRLMDTYVAQHAFANNPLFLGQISFDAAVTPKNAFYRILPVQISLESSRDNFFKFLEFLEQSGALSNRTRLMDLQRINLSFAQKQPSEDINFTATLHAYFAPAP